MGTFARYFIASEYNNYRPPVLSYKAFIIYGLLMLLLRIFLGTLPVSSAAVDSQTLMDLINKERSNRNLNTLSIKTPLLVAAGEKAQDMIDRDYFAHVDPDGNYVWYRIEDAGYKPYKILGENLALDFSTSEGMIQAWLDSPKHRDNLLHKDFVDQGLSALFGDYKGRYTNLTASIFGSLLTTSTPPPPAPIPQPPPMPAPPAQPPQNPSPPPPAPPPLPMPTPAPENPQPSPIPQTPVDATSTSQSAPTPNPEPPLTSPNTTGSVRSAYTYQTIFQITRILFTILGIFLLSLLSLDSVIIYQHEAQIMRSHSSYHFFSLMLIVLVSIFIWWW